MSIPSSDDEMSESFSNYTQPLRSIPWQLEKGKELWRHMKDMVKLQMETIDDMSYPSLSTNIDDMSNPSLSMNMDHMSNLSSFGGSNKDLSWNDSCKIPSNTYSGVRTVKLRLSPVEKELQKWREGSALGGARAMLASSACQDQRNSIKHPTMKKVGFVQGSILTTYAPMQERWEVTYFLHPAPLAIQRIWSAAGVDLLAQLSSPFASPSLADPCFLWSPFKNAFSLLPPFCSILNVTTLGYAVFGLSHVIMAIGTPSYKKQLVIEVFVLNNGIKSQWQKVIELHESIEILPESDFVEWNGSFYTYCVNPPKTFLEIKVEAPWVVVHQNMPYFDQMPRLVVCCDSLFLVDHDIVGDHYKLWKFHPECVETPWGLLLMEVPNVPGPLSFVSIKGLGSLLYFFYANGETFIYTLERTGWVRMPDCPTKPNMFPIILEEQEPSLNDF